MPANAPYGATPHPSAFGRPLFEISRKPYDGAAAAARAAAAYDALGASASAGSCSVSRTRMAYFFISA
jgi:hypothetical protein